MVKKFPIEVYLYMSDAKTRVDGAEPSGSVTSRSPVEVGILYLRICHHDPAVTTFNNRVFAK